MRVESWARSGLIDAQIAKNIGVRPQTICEWANRFPEFAEALKRGKKPVDEEVENALLKSALGFEYEETITEIIEQPDGSHRKQVKRFKRYSPPSNTAQIFWLKNRCGYEWDGKTEDDDEEGGVVVLPKVEG